MARFELETLIKKSQHYPKQSNIFLSPLKSVVLEGGDFI